MITRVVMPKLTDTMEEGVVVAWKKEEGDAVAAGDVLAEIETDKAVMDLEAFGSGFLRKVLVREGQPVKAGSLIAVIGELDDDIETALAETVAPEPLPTETPPSPSPQPTAPGTRVAERTAPPPPPEPPPQKPEIKASPRAKALARQHGIDLSLIQGTGPEGRIVERDLRGLEPPKPPSPEAQSLERPLSQMRKTIARVTVESKAPVPHFYLTTQIDMEETERIRKHAHSLRGAAVSMTAVFVKAAALALARHPEVNASFTGDAIRQHGRIDIGLAVALPDGLTTPVIRDCGTKDIFALSQEAKVLVDRARQRQLTPEEYTGATFSISNLGMYDVENFIAVIVPPQAACLAIGAIRTIPVVENNSVTVGRRMNVTLSCDHRALDGAQGAQFLQTFKHVLEQPLTLFVEGASLPKTTGPSREAGEA